MAALGTYALSATTADNLSGIEKGRCVRLLDRNGPIIKKGIHKSNIYKRQLSFNLYQACVRLDTSAGLRVLAPAINPTFP
ncbi:MAG: hypothetical protein QF393_14700 [Rhodospirillales bacterium]|jgi:hypothetical protein|nr:hypothetical protein [Rhodospirillales bacterium]MDP6646092.1 hypothetical protein [Rhodospirillales bacterium]|tara:strand:+ start:185 stop:424 length:240 start_codon:yes stop_codon:yes gene_type:complete